MSSIECKFLIIGGGIAGVSCAEAIAFLAPHERTILLTESSLIKAITNLQPLGKISARFEVQELVPCSQKFDIIVDHLEHICSKNAYVQVRHNKIIKYKYLCICTGARPKIIKSDNNANVQSHIIGIRDTESVEEFQRRIKNAKKMLILGNGGIASEIVYEIKGIQIDWVIKDAHISSTFVDSEAAKFFQNKLKETPMKIEKKCIVKRMRYGEGSTSHKTGAALGPDWHKQFDIAGNISQDLPESVSIHYNCEIRAIKEGTCDSSIDVELTNGERFEVDFIVSATGVVPWKNFTCDVNLATCEDGGILVDEMMKTSVNNIYAAGDVCTANWQKAQQWFQMRLWTQARQMGSMAGRSMYAASNNEEIYQDFCFELFNHVTQLFGYQVVLLGNYNGQGLGDNYEVLLRITPNKEYIKFVLQNGKLQGAILVGETALEETCENLILNQLDLTPYGDDLLNPNVDIEDYFD